MPSRNSNIDEEESSDKTTVEQYLSEGNHNDNQVVQKGKVTFVNKVDDGSQFLYPLEIE